MEAQGITRWVPGLGVARQYKRSWLWPDVRAGMVVTALLIPAGMGYAEVAGLPPETGLYATIVPLIAYAIFGPSRILVLGPDSSLAPIIAAAILPLALADGQRAVALAGLLAIMVGALLLLGGILQARLRHRPAVEAHPGRLSQRDRASGDRVADPQAAGLLDRRRWRLARDRRHRPEHPGR